MLSTFEYGGITYSNWDLSEGSDSIKLLIKRIGIEEVQKIIEMEEKRRKIKEYKELLSSSDYKAMKFAEGETSKEDYEPIKKQRKEWRNLINKLEEEMKF